MEAVASCMPRNDDTNRAGVAYLCVGILFSRLIF